MGDEQYAVWKFRLPMEGRFELEMPAGAEHLHLAVQGDVPCLWARVRPGAAKVRRRFAWVGTGHPAPSPSEGTPVGSVLLAGGTFVFHLFWAQEGAAR
jgi:hypothetical protein